MITGRPLTDAQKKKAFRGNRLMSILFFLMAPMSAITAIGDLHGGLGTGFAVINALLALGCLAVGISTLQKALRYKRELQR